MNTLNQTTNNNKTDMAHPSLGKALTNEQAMKRLNQKGFWACERKDKVRVVEFHEEANGDSASVTHWFRTWGDALRFYNMSTTTNAVCTICGEPHPATTRVNPLGQWICGNCFEDMNGTQEDHFLYSLGRWTI